MKKRFRYIFRKKRSPYGRFRRNPRRVEIPRPDRSQESRKCKICGLATREGKLYCPDHVDRHSYVMELNRQIAAKKEEEDAVRDRGVEAITEDSLTIKELLVHLQVHGSRTIERLSRELMLDTKVIAYYAQYLKEEGKVTLGVTKRGSIVVSPIRASRLRRYRHYG
jgi:hypothetical protein